MWTVEFDDKSGIPEVHAIELDYQWDNIPTDTKIKALKIDLGNKGKIRFDNFSKYCVTSGAVAQTGVMRGTLVGFYVYAVDKKKNFVVILNISGNGMKMEKRPLKYMKDIGLVQKGFRKGVVAGGADVKFTGVLGLEKGKGA